jgi:aquaporin related protein
MFPGDIGVVNTSLSGGTTIAQGVFIEMFMTAELVFVVLMLAAEKSKSTFIAPIGIGLALFVAMMGGMSSCLAREELISQFMRLTINRGLLYGRFT